MLGQSQEETKRCRTNPFPFPLHIRHQYLAQGTCFQDSFWAKSRVQELDHETGSGETPKLTDPAQLADTPQEEALRLDVQEVLKKPNLTLTMVKRAQEWA